MILKGKTHKATPHSAIVRWLVHKEISNFDIDGFSLYLYIEGANENYSQLKQVIQKSNDNIDEDIELIYSDTEIHPGDATDPKRGYKIEGLEPATVYRVKVIMKMPMIASCMVNYAAKGMNLKKDPNKPGFYKPLECTFPLLTSQKPIDEFVEEEL